MASEKLRVRWLEDSVQPGWYVERIVDGQIVEDSEKVSFLVDVDEYDSDAREELVQQLRVEYPDAQISDIFGAEERR